MEWKLSGRQEANKILNHSFSKEFSPWFKKHIQPVMCCSINTSQVEGCDYFSCFVGWTIFALQISTAATLIPPGSHKTPLNSANSDTGHVEH